MGTIPHRKNRNIGRMKGLFRRAAGKNKKALPGERPSGFDGTQRAGRCARVDARREAVL